MKIKVKVGDVFQVNWHCIADYEETVVYKVFNIVSMRIECVKLVIKGYDTSRLPRYTYFIADSIENNKAVIDFAECDHAKILPKIKAILYEPILDEFWKK